MSDTTLILPQATPYQLENGLTVERRGKYLYLDFTGIIGCTLQGNIYVVGITEPEEMHMYVMPVPPKMLEDDRRFSFVGHKIKGRARKVADKPTAAWELTHLLSLYTRQEEMDQETAEWLALLAKYSKPTPYPSKRRILTIMAVSAVIGGLATLTFLSFQR